MGCQDGYSIYDSQRVTELLSIYALHCVTQLLLSRRQPPSCFQRFHICASFPQSVTSPVEDLTLGLIKLSPWRSSALLQRAVLSPQCSHWHIRLVEKASQNRNTQSRCIEADQCLLFLKMFRGVVSRCRLQDKGWKLHL